MASVTEFKKLFEKFLRENKCPTGEIVKKKYYFPVDQLRVRTFSKIYNLLINISFINIFFRLFTHLCLQLLIYNGHNFKKC